MAAFKIKGLAFGFSCAACLDRMSSTMGVARPASSVNLGGMTDSESPTKNLREGRMKDDRWYRILSFEDNPADVFLIREALKASGLAAVLTVLADGQSAISLLERIEAGQEMVPDLVLLDLHLPRQDGFEVLRHLRSLATFRHVPVIVFTASDAREDREEAERLGANAFVRKSLNLNESLRIGEAAREMLEGR